jgi:hypothetical protein
MATFWPHSIMKKKSAQPGEGGMCTLHPLFHYIYHHILYNVVVYTPAAWEGRYTPFMSTTPLYLLCVQSYRTTCKRGTYPMGSHTVDTQGLAYQLDRMQITNSSREVRMPVQWAGLYCVRIMQKCTNGYILWFSDSTVQAARNSLDHRYRYLEQQQGNEEILSGPRICFSCSQKSIGE